MFKKPFRIKSQTLMKGSDRKKLRAEMAKAFTGLDQETLTQLLPNKEEVTVMKIYTHAGDSVLVYCVNKQPVMFEIDKEKVLYPSVYLLWKQPDLLPRFTTWPPVFNKLLDGADLMLPGLVIREQLTPNTFRHINKAQPCSVNLVGNKAPVVMGYTLISGSDFIESGMKGKGIRPLHLFGDELWAFGDKSRPPDLEDDPIPQSYLEEDDEEANVEETEAAGTENDGQGMEEEVDIATNEADGAAKSPESLNLEGMSLQSDTVEQTGDADDGGQMQDTATTQEQMDEMLQFCFLCALKSSVKKSDLPLATASFYKSHMMKFCPPGVHLDIKKSSFKKLSKFLKQQEDTGIIQIKTLSKGVDSVTEVDRSHELLRGFEAPEVTPANQDNTSADGIAPPQITELYGINANTLAVFEGLGYRKGDSLTTQDVRKCATEYIKHNNLQDVNNKSHVVLDPLLAEILLTKSEGDRGTLTWDAVFSRLQNKMSPVYEIALPGKAPYIRKGKIESITLDVVQKASNKKVTVVEGLESFGIDPKDFGHAVQVKMACSASVSPSQQKNKGPVVLIQGNQVTFVADLLINTYQIPKKYVKGLEKAPKSKKR